MAALAVAAVCATLAAERLAERWSSELARGSTLVIDATGPERENEIARALATLETTPGIVSAVLMERATQEALLAPWLGEDLPLDVLNVPALIVVEETTEGPDLESLRQRLSAEAPSARYDDHTRWRRPMLRVAERLIWIAGGAMLLITAATVTMVALATRAALAANRTVVQTLRLMGATDRFIAGAYIRRFTLRAFFGGMGGATLAALAFAALPDPGATTTFTTGLAPKGLEWVWVASVPFGIALSTYVAATLALRQVLSRLEEL
jgi:cell division transport system permease protein